MTQIPLPQSVEIVIHPRTRDLGGFSVGRILPFARRRMVGPFIFFDVIGPAQFASCHGIDVRPHPHIGLATVTYLFSGAIHHRDSLGYDQIIRPGDVNWMTAGRGIVHSERTDPETRAAGQTLHGIQSWIALPGADAQTDPSFHHFPKDALPTMDIDGVQATLIAGDAFGERSPVRTFSPMFYCSIDARAGGAIHLPDNHEERALFVVSGGIQIDGYAFEPGAMIVVRPGAAPAIAAAAETRIMALGGASLGERIIWWNLVATSQSMIDQAKQDWVTSAEAGFHDTPFALPPGEEEYIPLPTQ